MITRSLLIALILSVLPLTLFNLANTDAENNTNYVNDRYVIQLKPSQVHTTDTINSFANKYKVKPDIIYNNVINGFSAYIPKDTVSKLKNDPNVLYIEKDLLFRISNTKAKAEFIPSGIDRIDAELNNLTNSKDTVIAVIDTGIDRRHPDLRVVAGAKCPIISGPPAGHDDNGHGTHVAGIIAAKANGFGVVGVAPGFPLVSLKVLDFTGSGPLSCVIAAIDLVTMHADKIDVVNLSLGCYMCTSNILHNAIKNSVAAGVTYIVAAGNEADDASNSIPGAYPEVITVSAIGDSDGECGGNGPPTSDGLDDTFASFSNYGSVVDIAAPGVDIISTYLGGYAMLSGTSMAAPHVTGAAALYIEQNPTYTPNDVRNALLADAIPQTQSCTPGTGIGGFNGDPDSFAEPLLHIP